MSVTELVDQAKALSRSEQIELLDELICIVGVDDLALTPNQAADLDRRLDELDSGKAELIPGDKAIEEVRKRK